MLSKNVPDIVILTPCYVGAAGEAVAVMAVPRGAEQPRPRRLQVTWLGTSSGSPTPQRNVSSIAYRLPQGTFLVDCGEGTCRQVRRRPAKYLILLTKALGMRLGTSLGAAMPTRYVPSIARQLPMGAFSVDCSKAPARALSTTPVP